MYLCSYTQPLSFSMSVHSVCTDPSVSKCMVGCLATIHHGPSFLDTQWKYKINIAVLNILLCKKQNYLHNAFWLPGGDTDHPLGCLQQQGGELWASWIRFVEDYSQLKACEFPVPIASQEVLALKWVSSSVNKWDTWRHSLWTIASQALILCSGLLHSKQ